MSHGWRGRWREAPRRDVEAGACRLVRGPQLRTGGGTGVDPPVRRVGTSRTWDSPVRCLNKPTLIGYVGRRSLDPYRPRGWLSSRWRPRLDGTAATGTRRRTRSSTASSRGTATRVAGAHSARTHRPEGREGQPASRHLVREGGP